VRLRAAYRDSQQQRLITIARFVIGAIQAADITDAQCRAAFGLNASQWTNAKQRMQTYINAHNTVETAIGE
jgi:hypothetical protein